MLLRQSLGCSSNMGGIIVDKVLLGLISSLSGPELLESRYLCLKRLSLGPPCWLRPFNMRTDANMRESRAGGIVCRFGL